MTANPTRRWLHRIKLGLVLAAISVAGCQSAHEGLRFNQIQFVGSHNSYKQAIDPALLVQLGQVNSALAASLDYSHPPLREQLDLGLRKLELDIFHDPDGGLFANPFGLAGNPQAAPYDREAMALPGFKVMHVQDIDFRSHCALLRQCLADLVAWSVDNPKHLPVVITFNAKDEIIDQPGFTRPLPFDGDAFDRLDAVIREVMGDRIFAPDDLRGKHDSLPGAIAIDGWPGLDEMRGRFLFVLDHGGEKLAAYISGHPALRGRVLFVNAETGTPESAVRIINDPVGQFDEIRQAVLDGYLVRTRSDADTREARSGDVTRRDRAFASGAQIVSTDYYRADTRFGTGFVVRLPGGGVARCNPVLSPDCGVEILP